MIGHSNIESRESFILENEVNVIYQKRKEDDNRLNNIESLLYANMLEKELQEADGREKKLLAKLNTINSCITDLRIENLKLEGKNFASRVTRKLNYPILVVTRN